MTGFIVSVFLFRNRVSSKEAFEGLELGEGKLSRPVLRGPGGRKAAWLLGSDLRPWHRFWRDYGGTGNYRSLATPIVRSKPESLGATISNPSRDIPIRMVAGFSEIGHRNRVSVDRRADCPDLTCMERTDLLKPSFRRSCLRGFCESNLPLLSEHGPPSSHSDPLRLATLTRNHHTTRHSRDARRRVPAGARSPLHQNHAVRANYS